MGRTRSVCLFVCLFLVFDGLSVCLHACLPACLSVCLSLWFGKTCHCETCTRSVCLFVCLFWYLIVCLLTCLLVCLSVCRCGSARPVTVEPATSDGSHTVSLFVCLSLLVFDGLSVCLPSYLPACLSVCLSLCGCGLARPATVKPATTVYLFVRLFIFIFLFLVFDCLSAYLTVCLSSLAFECLSACQPVCLSVCRCGSARHVTVKPETTDDPSVYLFVCLSFWYLMDCLSAYLSAYMSACLPVSLSVCGSARPVIVKPATTDASHTVSLFVCLSLSFCYLVVCLSVCLFVVVNTSSLLAPMGQSVCFGV